MNALAKPIPMILRSTMTSTSADDVVREIAPIKAQHLDQGDDDYEFIDKNLRRWGDRVGRRKSA